MVLRRYERRESSSRVCDKGAAEFSLRFTVGSLMQFREKTVSARIPESFPDLLVPIGSRWVVGWVLFKINTNIRHVTEWALIKFDFSLWHSSQEEFLFPYATTAVVTPFLQQIIGQTCSADSEVWVFGFRVVFQVYLIVVAQTCQSHQVVRN